MRRRLKEQHVAVEIESVRGIGFRLGGFRSPRQPAGRVLAPAES